MSLFKAKVALEAAKDFNTLNELAAKYGVHPAQISRWKKQLLGGLAGIFTSQKKKTENTQKLDELYRQIGEVTVENQSMPEEGRKLCSLAPLYHFLATHKNIVILRPKCLAAF